MNIVPSSPMLNDHIGGILSVGTSELRAELGESMNTDERDGLSAWNWSEMARRSCGGGCEVTDSRKLDEAEELESAAVTAISCVPSSSAVGVPRNAKAPASNASQCGNVDVVYSRLPFVGDTNEFLEKDQVKGSSTLAMRGSWATSGMTTDTLGAERADATAPSVYKRVRSIVMDKGGHKFLVGREPPSELTRMIWQEELKRKRRGDNNRQQRARSLQSATRASGGKNLLGILL
jgi:hypothetical protein